MAGNSPGWHSWPLCASLGARRSHSLLTCACLPRRSGRIAPRGLLSRPGTPCGAPLRCSPLRASLDTCARCGANRIPDLGRAGRTVRAAWTRRTRPTLSVWAPSASCSCPVDSMPPCCYSAGGCLSSVAAVTTIFLLAPSAGGRWKADGSRAGLFAAAQPATIPATLPGPPSVCAARSSSLCACLSTPVSAPCGPFSSTHTRVGRRHVPVGQRLWGGLCCGTHPL
jgi:hypothetical protein